MPAAVQDSASRIIDLQPVSIETLPNDPDGQVECTLARMVKLANADASSPEIRRDAGSIPGVLSNQVLQGVHNWIRSHMTFVTDEQQTAPYVASLSGPDHYFVEAITRPPERKRNSLPPVDSLRPWATR